MSRRWRVGLLVGAAVVLAMVMALAPRDRLAMVREASVLQPPPGATEVYRLEKNITLSVSPDLSVSSPSTESWLLIIWATDDKEPLLDLVARTESTYRWGQISDSGAFRGRTSIDVTGCSEREQVRATVWVRKVADGPPLLNAEEREQTGPPPPGTKTYLAVQGNPLDPIAPLCRRDIE